MQAEVEEQVVLLDESGAPTGHQAKSTVHHAHTPLHLAFSVFLFDGAGRTLFQRRALHKPTWPGVWSNACCGHPAPGEPLLAAAHRRLRHELGIEAPVKLELALPRFRYRARWGELWENELCPVFVGAYRGPLAANPAEVVALRWIRWADFARGCRSDAPSEFDAFSPWSRWEAAELLALPVSTQLAGEAADRTAPHDTALAANRLPSPCAPPPARQQHRGQDEAPGRAAPELRRR